MVKNNYKIVLCEGKTDRILIGRYLVNKYGFKCENDRKEEVAFQIKYENDFYTKETDEIFVVQANSSTELNACMKYIRKMLNYLNNAIVAKIVIVTDHDDAHSVGFKQAVEEIFIDNRKQRLTIGEASNVKYKNKYDEELTLDLMYILIPEHEEGALETFLVDVIADDDNKFIIDGLKIFLKNAEKEHSEKYLAERNERTKALLSMLLAAMHPNRNKIPFYFLDNIDWTDKEKFNSFFDKIGTMLLDD